MSDKNTKKKLSLKSIVGLVGFLASLATLLALYFQIQELKESQLDQGFQLTRQAIALEEERAKATQDTEANATIIYVLDQSLIIQKTIEANTNGVSPVEVNLIQATATALQQELNSARATLELPPQEIIEFDFVTPTTPLPSPSSSPLPLPELDLSGIWDFTTVISQTIDASGFIRPISSSGRSVIRLTQTGEIITGELLGAEGNLGDRTCSAANILGTIQGENVMWTLQFEGSCCGGNQIDYTGTTDIDRNNLIGYIRPVDVPIGSCILGYASFVATKR